MRFHDPHLLWLLLLLPLLAAFKWWRDRQRRTAVRFPDVTHLKQLPRPLSLKCRQSLKVLRVLALALLIVAMARPQEGQTVRNVETEGIAIALVIDCSESMSKADFRPNRLEAAKRVIVDFVDGRESDEICAVIYGANSLLACPMTLDYGVLKDFVARLSFERLGRQFISRTAIGMGLANALRQLEKSEAKSKVAILLTDGRNNAGEIEPLKAAEMAKTLGVRVYTIGVGTKVTRRTQFGDTPIFGMANMGMELDEDMLTEIAEKTGGKYYHAGDERKLKGIYEKIDELEKQKLEIPEYDSYDERMAGVLLVALGLLLLETLLAYTRFLSLP